MKCPYCGSEMEVGNLKTEAGPGLFYMPGDKSYGIFPTQKNVENKGGIILDGPNLTRFHYTSVECYACKSCRKIVIPF